MTYFRKTRAMPLPRAKAGERASPNGLTDARALPLPAAPVKSAQPRFGAGCTPRHDGLPIPALAAG
jgi:hypothetical protein